LVLRGGNDLETRQFGSANPVTPDAPLTKGTIPFVLTFSLIGLFALWVAGDDFYHWYVTGYLYFPAKYSHGVYTSYGDVRGLFIAAVLKNLTVMVMGIVAIVAACTAPSFFRKKEQARLAAKAAQLRHPPWPSRPKRPD
jgi:hypothetical protein